MIRQMRTRALRTITIPVPIQIQIQARSFGTSLSLNFTKQRRFKSFWTKNPSISSFAFVRLMSGSTSSISLQELSQGKVEILDSLEKLRLWRKKALLEDKDVGFVPTMGALHDGHLSLVRESLAHNPLTVVSIFVNPAQFAPHEDLATYPRTIERDIQLLIQTKSESESEITNGKRLAIFVPPTKEMYPSGITQDVNQQRGTFIRVQGYEDEMEGKARPGFFRGVATVVMKLFNAVEAYFGQKDIQQALLLRRLCSDLLLSHPLPEKLHIVPTGRDPATGLALSSRNAYLAEKEYKWAPILWNAILKGRAEWENSFDQLTKDSKELGRFNATRESSLRERVIAAASNHILETAEKAKEDGVEIRLNYIELNWADTFKIVQDEDLLPSESSEVEVPGKVGNRTMILSGAVWVGKTRLIDNMILGDTGNIIY